MPTLFGMVRGGAVTWDAHTIFPSITLPSHTSMLTGVGPDKHKITWNDYQAAKGTVTVPTIFALAHRQGLVTGLFAGKEKFKHLDVPGSLDAFEIPGYEAKKVAEAAFKFILERKPNLCFLHFADSDGEGHKIGWGSPEQVKAFAAADAALKTLRKAIKDAGIEKTSVVILSADHGGHGKGHGSFIEEDMHIPWIAWGKGVRRHFTITDPVTTYDTAATALWLLDVPLPASFDGKPVLSAFRK
jgi:predicted AlkP superfamily pyrophosphatase or phosphodiesterase